MKTDVAPLHVDKPIAGTYKTRLVKNGVFVPIRIWYGPPLDPITGEEMDRSWRWRARRGDEFVDVSAVWPFCAQTPVTAEEYDHMMRVRDWAMEHAPDAPEARPYEPVDLSNKAPLF